MTISTIRIPPVIRTQRRRQNGGLSDPSPPSSSTGGLEGVCGGGGGGIEGLAVCGGYHFPSLACHQPSPCDASAPPLAMVDHPRMLLGGRLRRSTVCCHLWWCGQLADGINPRLFAPCDIAGRRGWGGVAHEFLGDAADRR